MRPEKNIVDGNYYSSYENLVYYVPTIAVTRVEFDITINAVVYKKEIPVIGGQAKLLVSDLLDLIKTNNEVLRSQSELSGIGAVTQIDIDTVNIVTTTASIYVLDCIAPANVAVYSNNFLTTRREIDFDNRFETGLYFFGAKVVDIVTSQGAFTVTGAANDINYLSMRNVLPVLQGGIEVKNPTNLQIGNGDVVTVRSIPCTEYAVSMVKFKSMDGGWNYLYFYGKKNISIREKAGSKQTFEAGQYSTGGTMNLVGTLIRSDLSASETGLITELSANQNVWWSPYWQFSDFSVILESSTPATGKRLIEFTPTGYQYNEMLTFAQGDRVGLERFDLPYTSIDMWGEVVQVSTSKIVLYFEAQAGNDDLTALDFYISQSYPMRIVRFDAWQLATVSNATKWGENTNKLGVNITVETNEFQNYNI